MNDVELDALAARAAAHTRAEARSIADSEAALQRLLADAATDAPAPLTQVVPYHGPIRDQERRHRVRLLAVAAGLALFVVGIGYAVLRSDTTIRVAGPPAGTGTGPGLSPAPPSSATPPPATAPVTGSASAPDSSATTATTATTPVTDPATATTEATPRPTETLVFQDPFAGWEAPALRPRLLYDVPYLLPGDGRWANIEVFRSEWESGETDATYTQVWVRAVRASTRVDGVLVLTSRFGPMPPVAGEPVEINGWTSAVERDTVDGVVTFDVASPMGSVNVWALGISRSDVITIVSSLRTDVATGAGWLLAPVADEPWIAIDPGVWSLGFASRSVRVLDPTGAPGAEITAVSGLPVGSVGPGFLGMDLALTAETVPSLLFSDGTRSAVVTRRPDGIVVSVGVTGTIDEALALATNLDEVDRPTWEAATTPDPDFGDGCSGLFC